MPFLAWASHAVWMSDGSVLTWMSSNVIFGKLWFWLSVTKVWLPIHLTKPFNRSIGYVLALSSTLKNTHLAACLHQNSNILHGNDFFCSYMKQPQSHSISYDNHCHMMIWHTLNINWGEVVAHDPRTRFKVGYISPRFKYLVTIEIQMTALYWSCTIRKYYNMSSNVIT